MSVKLAVKRLVLSRDLFDSKTLDQQWTALLPHGSPFGDPGTHGSVANSSDGLIFGKRQAKDGRKTGAFFSKNTGARQAKRRAKFKFLN